MEGDRGGERLGRHARVAVHVPPAQLEKRIGASLSGLRAEPVLELAHQLRHRVEQHAVEEVQVALDLVLDLRARAADLGGLPPERERLADAVDGALVRGAAEPVVVEPASFSLTSDACCMTDQRVASVGCAVSVRSSRRPSSARAAAFEER